MRRLMTIGAIALLLAGCFGGDEEKAVSSKGGVEPTLSKNGEFSILLDKGFKDYYDEFDKIAHRVVGIDKEAINLIYIKGDQELGDMVYGLGFEFGRDEAIDMDGFKQILKANLGEAGNVIERPNPKELEYSLVNEMGAKVYEYCLLSADNRFLTVSAASIKSMDNSKNLIDSIKILKP